MLARFTAQISFIGKDIQVDRCKAKCFSLFVEPPKLAGKKVSRRARARGGFVAHASILKSSESRLRGVSFVIKGHRRAVSRVYGRRETKVKVVRSLDPGERSKQAYVPPLPPHRIRVTRAKGKRRDATGRVRTEEGRREGRTPVVVRTKERESAAVLGEKRSSGVYRLCESRV